MIIVTVKYEGYKRFALDMTKEEFEKEYVETHRSIEHDANPFDDSVDDWIDSIQEVEDENERIQTR